jgi:hypothetical protein
MDAEQLFADVRQALLGRPITFTRLAANSLILYVDCQPDEKRGFAIWLEPTWHLSSPQGVLVGSRQAQGKGEQGASKAELDDLGAPLKVLTGLPITGIDLDPRTNDLTLAVDRMYLVRTFVADPSDAHSWHIRDKAKLLSVYGSPGGLEVHEGQRRTKSSS